MAHHLILDVYVSPNRKYVNLSIIYYITDFSFFMSQDDAYFHIHQNDPHVGPNEAVLSLTEIRLVIVPILRTTVMSIKLRSINRLEFKLGVWEVI